jgi:hypothetical protein
LWLGKGENSAVALEANGLSMAEGTANGTPLSPTDIADLRKGYSVLVTCISSGLK